ncbi:hypothetical protein G7B40_037640 [Aetokthonos hydrillicola Thurmond2011]|jgi:hypothetical protein|uniref:Uncharacterized protein n=1 Tax=Aetokthonos hydrillicola Thurmond2011 TaxID=2712845 RepID=A0AAP5IGK7_9CYAN|nr:hypothetical protein [Aetokthonos hydrillicola]MBO3461207.1 hypothetical protein [Aetokthonos hydrillicola CCALA 1050]MBW4589739.1 hypothetical protein [Aetokthonos hydrillicola CCALA 1050]MDR9900234.1 hypothetical protein [Aetokthonos hydrillicola Thurmond2011]
MNEKKTKFPEIEYNLFLVKKSHEYRLSEIERRIFIMKFGNNINIQEIGEQTGCQVKQIEELFNKIYHYLENNQMKLSSELDESLEERLGSFLLLNFFESLAKINIKDNLDNQLKKIEANINLLNVESLGDKIFHRFFYRVSSLNQFIEALEELKKEMNTGDNLFQNKIIFQAFCRAIPRISERLASVSHFSERSVCLDLLQSLESISLKNALSWQEECEQYHKKNINKTFDFFVKKFYLNPKNTLDERVQDKLNNKLEYRKSELSNHSIENIKHPYIRKTKNRFLTLIGGLTVAGTVAFSVGISVTLKTPSEISKPLEQVAQQPRNSTTTTGDGNITAPELSGSNNQLSTNVNKAITNNNNSKKINTHNYTENDNTRHQTNNCSCSEAKLGRGSLCTNTNGGKVENHF